MVTFMMAYTDYSQDFGTGLALGDIRFLVIDDSISMRSIIRDLLRQVGFETVEEAGDGEEALKILRDEGAPDPDVIICDLHMKGMDGIEFCNTIRRDKKIRRQSIPVLILTGDTDNLMHEVSRQVGACEVLTKPVSANDLLRHVRNAIGLAVA